MKLSLWPALLAVLLAPEDLRAAEYGEWVIGLAPSYSFIVLEQQSQPKGGGGSLFLHYGLSKTVGLRLSGLWSGHEIEGTEKNPGGLLQVYAVALGVRYAFDLAKFNPALEGGIGFLHRRYQKAAPTDLGLQFGIACDYWLLSWLGVGAAFHYHSFLSNPTEYPVYFDAGPRISFRLPPRELARGRGAP